MSTICIHQPDFAPWLGFFHRLVESDIYVVFDDVQFLRRAWHHRDKILGPKGSQWLTVPVLKKGRYRQEIREVEVDNTRDWRQRHLRTMAHVYGQSPGFHETFPSLQTIYGRRHHRLIDFNLEIITWMLKRFKIDVEIVLSSDIPGDSNSTERLLEIVQALGGSHYITGTGSRDYLDSELFRAQKIELYWQDFHHPAWDQGRESFLSGLSALDALFCVPEPSALLHTPVPL